MLTEDQVADAIKALYSGPKPDTDVALEALAMTCSSLAQMVVDLRDALLEADARIDELEREARSRGAHL